MKEEIREQLAKVFDCILITVEQINKPYADVEGLSKEIVKDFREAADEIENILSRLK